MKKSILAMATAAALLAFGAPASAGLVFKVDESVVPDATGGVFTTDRASGQYTELIGSTGAGTFSASAVGIFSNYLLNNAAIFTGLNGALISSPNAAYRMYVKFVASGNVSGTTFTGTAGKADIYLDPSSNTAFSDAGGVNFTDFTDYATPTIAGTDSDDLHIGSSTISFGTGQIGAAPSAFSIFFDGFTLTSFGETYWTDPNPFYLRLQATGGTQEFLPDFPFSTSGDFSVVAAVPEPGSLALLGLGLAGLGLAQRRRKQVK